MRDQKIKIAFLIPELSGGGICATAINLYRNLNPEIYDIIIAAYDSVRSCEADPCIKTVSFGLPSTRGVLKRIRRTVAVYFKVKKFKKKFNPDITLSFKDNANLINLFTRHNDKILMSVHTTPSADYRGLHGYLYKFMIRSFFRRSDMIITVSDGIKNDMITNYGLEPHLFQTVYNSIDPSKIQLMSEEGIEPELSCLFSGVNTVICVGRLTRAKGQWHLIRAFKEVLNEFPDSKLVIIGEGEMRPFLEKTIQDLDLSRNVFLTGNRNNPYKYLKRSGVFVLSSIYEGFGIVIVEAMACGLPVISTDCRSGPGEILRDESGNTYGLLVDPPDGICYDGNSPATKEEMDLSKKIRMLIRDRNLAEKYRDLSKKRYPDFSTNTIMPQWDKIFKKITG